MKIAVLDENHNTLEFYRDVLECFTVELYDDQSKFFSQFHNQYDVIILSHRMGGNSWKKLFTRLKSDKLFIVTATHPPIEYKKEYPGLFRDLTQEIKKHKNVLFKEKEDFKGILKLIDNKSREFEIKEITRRLTVAYCA